MALQLAFMRSALARHSSAFDVGYTYFQMNPEEPDYPIEYRRVKRQSSGSKGKGKKTEGGDAEDPAEQ